MKIVVVGCGAMGSIYAALLAAAGHQLSVVDPNAEHINAINAQGLRVWGASGDRTVRISAFLQPPEEQADLVICAVKANFIDAAAQSLTPLLGPHTCVLTIQNGLGSADIMAAQVGAERVIVGVAQGFGASLPEPGCAYHNDMKAIRMGAYNTDAASLASSSVGGIARLWAEAGFDAAAVADITAMQWQKLICNVAYSAPCALAGLTVGAVMEHPLLGAISRMAAVEAFDVAQALGIKLNFNNPEQEVREFAQRMPNAKPSVLLDLEAGRSSEVGVINGAVPIQGQKVGVEAPVNAALTTLVQTLETERSATS